MPYAFTARSWELQKVFSIDILDAMGSAIRIDISNNQVRRIIPCLNENINEEWITNKARFSYDALNTQRLLQPQIKLNSMFIILSWYHAFCFFLRSLWKLKQNLIEVVCGPFISLEAALCLKSYFIV
jgi:NADH dehydrogenase/NADH:ubiquinone oxidoreductase subunit G